MEREREREAERERESSFGLFYVCFKPLGDSNDIFFIRPP